MPNMMIMRMKYSTMNVQVYEEYEVQDIYTFIGTVGGSLGLFLGFSFLTFVTDIIGKVFDYLHGIESLSLPSLSVASEREASDSVSSENEESNSESVVNLKFKHGKSKKRKRKHHNPKNPNQKPQT